MEEKSLLLGQALPVFESWLRSTIADVVSEVLQADREKRQPEMRLSREEAAERLGISVVTLWSWCKTGKIRPIMVGKRQFFLKDEIEAILNRRA